jgi:hypothetical protein
MYSAICFLVYYRCSDVVQGCRSSKVVFQFTITTGVQEMCRNTEVV